MQQKLNHYILFAYGSLGDSLGSWYALSHSWIMITWAMILQGFFLFSWPQMKKLRPGGKSFTLECVCAQSLNLVRFLPPQTVAWWAPLSVGFSRQEYWSRSSFSSPGDLPDPGIEPVSLASTVLAGGFFTIVPPFFRVNGKPHLL